MEYKNFWGTSQDFKDDLKHTDNIHKIMEEQCKYLVQFTKGNVFAVFGEIKIDGSMVAVAKGMANVLKSVSGLSRLQENIEELSTQNLVNANSMYFDKRYGFEICTEKYRFRLFELRMTPVYPVEIIVDEGICKNVGSALARITSLAKNVNHFEIVDEDMFCEVLQIILQDKKVRYIISELQKRVQDKIEENILDKVIICEGSTDEIILQAIAKKLNQKVVIVAANGKCNVPVVFDAVKGNNTKSNVLIVIDSDGDEEGTRNVIVENVNSDNYELVIVNNCIEDWFMPDVADFSKLKLIQSIDTIIENLNFEELSKINEGFNKVVAFLQK